MSTKTAVPTLKNQTSFLVNSSDDFDGKGQSNYDCANGPINKSNLDKDYKNGKKNEDGTYGALEIGNDAWVIVYDKENYSGSLKRFHNTVISDLGDIERAEDLKDNGTMDYNDNDWDNTINSWRLSNTKLYNTEAMTNAFLSPYAPCLKTTANGYTNFSNPSPSEMDFPSEKNRYIDIYQGEGSFRIFWPFYIQTGNIMDVWLTLEDQNLGDNGVVYVKYSLDLTTGAFSDGSFEISYHNPTAPQLTDFQVSIINKTITAASDGVKLAANVALDVFADGAGKHITDGLIDVGTKVLTFTVSHANEIILAISKFIDSTDSATIHFPRVVSNAIIKSANAVLNQVASEGGSSTELSNYANNLQTQTLNTNTYAQQITGNTEGWDDSTNTSTVSLKDSNNILFHFFFPEQSGLINNTGLLCSCVIECMSYWGDNDSDNNPHCSLSVMFDSTGALFSLSVIFYAHSDSSNNSVIGHTGLITYGDNNMAVQIYNDENGNQTINYANNNDIRAFFTDRFMYQLQATFPTSYDVRQNLITMTNKAIDAFIASVD